MIQALVSPIDPAARTAATKRLLILALVVCGLVSGCTSEIDSQLATVRELEASGDLAGSIVVLKKILETDPEHAEANFLLGTALVQSGRLRPAIFPLVVATQVEQYAIPAGVLLASTQFRINAYEDAVRAANLVLDRDPKNLTALFARGQSFLAVDKPTEALADANSILEIKPDTQNAMMMKSGALFRLDRRDEAEAIWIDFRDRSAASQNPNTAARACAQLARYYLIHDEKERADATYAACLEQYPTHAYLQRAANEFYIREDRPERAIEIQRRAVKETPDDIRAWGRLARVLYDYGKPGEAQRTIEESVERFDSPAAWRLLAAFHQRTRNATEARKAIEASILRSPEPDEALQYALAELLVEEGDLERARDIAQNLRRPAYQQLIEGAISLKTGNPKQALEKLDAGLALWPDNATAHHLAGEAALLLRDRARAVTEFQEAVRIGNNDTDAALRLAEINFARGTYHAALTIARFQNAQRPYLNPTPYHIAIRSALALDRIDEATKAVEDLRRADPTAAAVVVEGSAIKRAEEGAAGSIRYILASDRDLSDPKNEPILRALASDLNELERGAEALGFVERALAREDDDAPLHDLHARVLSQLGRNDEARIATKRALAIDPSFAPALEMKAYLALEDDDQATALAAMDAATEASPFDKNYPYSAASIARKMGDVPGAISRLEEALSRQPLFGPAANDLAWILATDRLDLERALRLAQIAVRQDESTKTLTTLGWVRHQRGEFDDAIKSYESALADDGDVPTLRYRLGLALSEAGRTDEAKGLFDALVEGPDFPEIEAARDALERIKGS